MSFCPLSIIYGSGASAITLAGTSDVVEGPLKLDGRPLVQYVELARAADAVPLNRGNRRRRLEFTVKRQPAADPIQALQFIAEHDLQLDAGDAAGFNGATLIYGLSPGSTLTLGLLNAVIQHTGWHVGRMPVSAYVIDFGGLLLSGTGQPFTDSNAVDITDSNGVNFTAA